MEETWEVVGPRKNSKSKTNISSNEEKEHSGNNCRRRQGNNSAPKKYQSYSDDSVRTKRDYRGNNFVRRSAGSQRGKNSPSQKKNIENHADARKKPKKFPNIKALLFKQYRKN